MDPKLKPGSRFCKCTVCGEYFTGEAAFDSHRVWVEDKCHQKVYIDKQHQREGWSESRPTDASKSIATGFAACVEPKVDTSQRIAGNTIQEGDSRSWAGASKYRRCLPPLTMREVGLFTVARGNWEYWGGRRVKERV